VALALVMSCAVAAQNVTVNVNIEGNTVNYTAQGLQPGAKYRVNTRHDPSGESSCQSRTADENGAISGSGTAAGKTINPGQSVTVRVYTANQANEAIGSTTVGKPAPPAPWWAYTGIGTLLYLI